MYIDGSHHKVVFSVIDYYCTNTSFDIFQLLARTASNPGAVGIHGFTDSRIHGCVAHRSEGDERGVAEVCGGLRDQRHSNQAQSSRLKIILESLNLRIPQNVEGTESARAKGKEKTESERREREVIRTRGWREE